MKMLFCKARIYNILFSNPRLGEQMGLWKYVMVKDHKEKIRVLTITNKWWKETAVQFSNTTGKRAARLRLLKAVSTVTVAHDGQHRVWKICMSSPLAASRCWCSTGRTWNIYRKHREEGQCEECLGKHEQNSSAVLLWGIIAEPPSAPGAALAQ